MLNRPIPPRTRAFQLKAVENQASADLVKSSRLGNDITISGNIHADTDLQIDGRVEGDISCTALVQGNASEVVGAIVADTAQIAGHVHGSVAARDVVILKSACVHGDIVYDSLTIEHGAQLNGRLTPRHAQAQAITRHGEGGDAPLVITPPTLEAVPVGAG